VTACGPANYAEILIARFDSPLAGVTLLPSFPLLPPARGLSNPPPTGGGPSGAAGVGRKNQEDLA